jgi:hypothetical protein
MTAPAAKRRQRRRFHSILALGFWFTICAAIVVAADMMGLKP